MSASILRSDASAGFLPGAGLFRDLRVEEHVVLKVNGATMADVETKMTLERKDVADAASDLFTRTFDAGSFAFGSIDALTPLAPALPYANRPAIEGLRDRQLGSILAEVGSLLAKKPQADFDGALNLLVQSLRIEPGRARALLDELGRGKVDEQTRSMVYLALGLAGGKEARAALADVIQDPRRPEGDRLQAISALAGVPDPDSAVTDTLLEARDQRGASILALGALAHNPRVDAEEKQRIVGALSDELSHAKTAGEKADAIAAMGNARDRGLRDRVAEYTGSSEPAVSAAAYRDARDADSPPGRRRGGERRGEGRAHPAVSWRVGAGAPLAPGPLPRARRPALIMPRYPRSQCGVAALLAVAVGGARRRAARRTRRGRSALRARSRPSRQWTSTRSRRTGRPIFLSCRWAPSAGPSWCG